MEERPDEAPEARDWLGIKPFGSIARCLSVESGNDPIEPYMHSRHWAHQRFYVNKLAQDFEEVPLCDVAVILYF